MIGQTKLIEKINTYTIHNFPHSLMLVGPYGCGKHEVVQVIANKFNLAVIDISSSLTLETIEEISISTVPRIYLIDTRKILSKNKVAQEENIILKSLEEPSQNTFIILLSERPSDLLPTIISRCVIWKFEPYTLEDLKKFSSDEHILAISDTPGQIIKILNGQANLFDSDQGPLDNLFDFANKVVSMIDKASISSALTIGNKISFNSEAVEKDKHDGDLFMKIMLYLTRNFCIDNDNINSYKLYAITQDSYTKMQIPYVNKSFLFYQYILRLREAKKELVNS